MTQHAAHASIIVVAGREYRVRRDFALICRIEERFGPLREFAERLEQVRFTVRDLADLYRLMLADQSPPPTPEEIQQQVVAIGIAGAVAVLHPISTAFFLGEEHFMRRVAEQAGPDRPLQAPALSPGANSGAQPHA